MEHQPTEPAREAVVETLEERRDRYRRSRDACFNESWLRSFVQGEVYDPPTGADSQGWITAGEVDDVSGFWLGYVLFRPATGERCVVWVDGKLSGDRQYGVPKL